MIFNGKNSFLIPVIYTVYSFVSFMVIPTVHEELRYVYGGVLKEYGEGYFYPKWMITDLRIGPPTS
jgi:hypothetical protein